MFENLNTMQLIVKIIILLFIFASGAVFIHYGNKIKDGKISDDDKQAGGFIFSFGIIGFIVNIISLIMFGYHFKKLKKGGKYPYIILYISIILFTTASNIILIIYGLKMHQNNICTDIQCPYSKCIDDFSIAKFIVAFGSICIIFSSIIIIFLIYKKITNKKSPDSEKEDESEELELESVEQKPKLENKDTKNA
jgi:TRAP-type C4-dicarboxylate transport system permease small subunit